jgi:hypothetical protein
LPQTDLVPNGRRKCHPDRETWLALEAAGFDRVAYDRFAAPSLIISPRIVGTAAKAAWRTAAT